MSFKSLGQPVPLVFPPMFDGYPKGDVLFKQCKHDFEDQLGLSPEFYKKTESGWYENSHVDSMFAVYAHGWMHDRFSDQANEEKPIIEWDSIYGSWGAEISPLERKHMAALCLSDFEADAYQDGLNLSKGPYAYNHPYTQQRWAGYRAGWWKQQGVLRSLGNSFGLALEGEATYKSNAESYAETVAIIRKESVHLFDYYPHYTLTEYLDIPDTVLAPSFILGLQSYCGMLTTLITKLSTTGTQGVLALLSPLWKEHLEWAMEWYAASQGIPPSGGISYPYVPANTFFPSGVETQFSGHNVTKEQITSPGVQAFIKAATTSKWMDNSPENMKELLKKAGSAHGPIELGFSGSVDPSYLEQMKALVLSTPMNLQTVKKETALSVLGGKMSGLSNALSLTQGIELPKYNGKAFTVTVHSTAWSQKKILPMVSTDAVTFLKLLSLESPLVKELCTVFIIEVHPEWGDLAPGVISVLNSPGAITIKGLMDPQGEAVTHQFVWKGLKQVTYTQMYGGSGGYTYASKALGKK